MDVLGLYLLQRVSDDITILRNDSFEKRYYTPVPDNMVAQLENDGYVAASKDMGGRITEGGY